MKSSTLSRTWLVAGASSGGAYPTTYEEYVRDTPGSLAMACAHIHIDGGSCEKTIFMYHENGEWYMHGLFVDDMIHASTSKRLKLEFIAEYKRDIEITCEELMTSFLWMEVEKGRRSIRLLLDNCIQETLSGYHMNLKAAIRNFVKPKQVPMQPGVVLEHDLCSRPQSPQILESKRYIVLLWQNCSLPPHGSDATLPSPLHSWQVSLCWLEHSNGQLCTM
jgi:hypothetical protein